MVLYSFICTLITYITYMLAACKPNPSCIHLHWSSLMSPPKIVKLRCQASNLWDCQIVDRQLTIALVLELDQPQPAWVSQFLEISTLLQYAVDHSRPRQTTVGYSRLVLVMYQNLVTTGTRNKKRKQETGTGMDLADDEVDLDLRLDLTELEPSVWRLITPLYPYSYV